MSKADGEVSASKVHIVIPSRYGSNRLPGKPLIDLAGVPMAVRVYRLVKKACFEVDVLLAIDDSRIAVVLDDHAVPWVMTKKDHESGTDRIAEVGRLQGWQQDDLVINVQGDEPLAPLDMLRSFIDFCQARHDLEMATISAPLESAEDIENPNVVKLIVNKNSFANYFSRSPLPFCRDAGNFNHWPVRAFVKHVGVYAYRYSVLKTLAGFPVSPLEQQEKLEQLRALWHGYEISVFHWHIAPPHGVDTLADVVRVNKVLMESNS
jgi:3-deoxy-manno-octulosonate cytidylyltransferase (CMP-KDO synthetase)